MGRDVVVVPMHRMVVRRLVFSVVLLAASVFAVSAHAEAVKCQRAIAKEAAKFAQIKAAVLAKCEELRLKGRLVGVCPDATAAGKIEKAVVTLGAKIGKACGGKDKVCGGDLTNEDDLASIGWPAVCPTLGNGTCASTIASCADIAPCLECVHGAAVDQVITLAYRSAQSSTAGSPLNKCQVAIGKSTVEFLQEESKALLKCWDARLQHQHANLCPSPGDGKAQATIDKAARKQRAVICKACGGGDKACGGSDDLTPAAIGFFPACPAIGVPGGEDCGVIGTIDDPGALTACLACVTKVRGECLERLQAPAVVDYPSECNAVIEDPGPGPTQQCTVTKDANGFFQLTSPLSDYSVHLPAAYDVEHPQPTRLLVGLHGCGDTAANFATWAVVPFSLRATHDYIGISVGGRDGQCWNIAQDGAVVAAAIAHVRSCFYVHQKQIVIGGYDSGGMLAYDVGLRNAASYAGILVENSGLSQAVGSANVDAVLQAAAWHINVAHTARLGDTLFPIAGVRADRDKMLSAGIGLEYRELAGDHDGTSDDWADFLLPEMASWSAP